MTVDNTGGSDQTFSFKGIIGGFTSADVEEALALADKWNGEPIPDAMFLALAPMFVQPYIQVVVLQVDERGLVQVLLRKRSSDDPLFGGFLDIQGTLLRPQDIGWSPRDFKSEAFARIQREIGNKFEASPRPVAVEDLLAERTDRGPELVLTHWATIPRHSQLPADAIWSHVHKLRQGEVKGFIREKYPRVEAAAYAYLRDEFGMTDAEIASVGVPVLNRK